MTPRVAVYYAPEAHDPLWRAGCRWLGRDPESGRRIPTDREEIKREPSRYGFHATLKPPMRPAYAWAALLEDAAALAARWAPFDLPPLEVANLGGFLALREPLPCPALQALADACVVDLDAHRSPPDTAELARRRAPGLTPTQDAMLLDWGYPHVLSTWRFHMTLTRRLTDAERAVVQPEAEAWFAEALSVRRQVKEICLFTQIATDAAFVLAERLAFGGSMATATGP